MPCPTVDVFDITRRLPGAGDREGDPGTDVDEQHHVGFQAPAIPIPGSPTIPLRSPFNTTLFLANWKISRQPSGGNEIFTAASCSGPPARGLTVMLSGR